MEDTESDHEIIDENNAFIGLQRGHSRNYGEEAKLVKEKFIKYFNNEGKVELQDKMTCIKILQL